VCAIVHDSVLSFPRAGSPPLRLKRSGRAALRLLPGVPYLAWDFAFVLTNGVPPHDAPYNITTGSPISTITTHGFDPHSRQGGKKPRPVGPNRPTENCRLPIGDSHQEEPAPANPKSQSAIPNLCRPRAQDRHRQGRGIAGSFTRRESLGSAGCEPRMGGLPRTLSCPLQNV